MNLKIKNFSKIEKGQSLESFELDIEQGWKTLHGDIFRIPSKIFSLSSL